jgi:hypothetical protein
MIELYDRNSPTTADNAIIQRSRIESRFPQGKVLGITVRDEASFKHRVKTEPRKSTCRI